MPCQGKVVKWCKGMNVESSAGIRRLHKVVADAILIFLQG